MLPFSGIALATSSASLDVIIYAFDQNPAGSDKGNEWVTFYNPSNESADIGNWALQTTHGSVVTETIPEGTILNHGAYYVYTPPYQWHYQSSCIVGLNLILLIFKNNSLFFLIISISIFRLKSLYRS